MGMTLQAETLLPRYITAASKHGMECAVYLGDITDGIIWPGTAALITPTKITNSPGITIASAIRLRLQASVSADNLIVDGILTVNSGQTLTIANGAEATDMEVSATGIINNAGSIGATGTIVFDADANYNHTQNVGTVPSATWNTSSNCNITGATTVRCLPLI